MEKMEEKKGAKLVADCICRGKKRREKNKDEGGKLGERMRNESRRIEIAIGEKVSEASILSLNTF